MNFEYRLKTQIERFGDVELHIQALENLNQTIDDLFAELERTGNASLLEELCPYFGQVWPSARALCEVLASKSLRGMSVLEVGCGLAVPSILAARLGASVTATDFHPEVPRFLDRNREANRISAENLRYVAIDWRGEAHPEILGQFDWVIGSDVLYERQHALQLAEVVSRLVRPQGKITIADPARPYLQAFVDRMKELGFKSDTQVLRVVEDAGDSKPRKDVFVCTFT